MNDALILLAIYLTGIESRIFAAIRGPAISPSRDGPTIQVLLLQAT
jgi:hypothetical protein